MPDLLIGRSAVISACQIYRPRLDRDLRRQGRVGLFLGVNPSKADGKKDDHSIRKMYGFSNRLDIGRFMVGNLFDYRATDVDELRYASKPCSDDNDDHLRDMIGKADLVIACWGPPTKLPPLLRERWRDVVDLVRDAGTPIHCLGETTDGHPRHPLMTPYDTPLTRWRSPR